MPCRPLSATPALKRLSFGHFSESDKKNAALRKQILERDNNKCADCGVVLARHMEVRNLDDNHDNLDPGNLVCVCPFCHMRDHLHTAGYARAGLVITSTKLDQPLINGIVLACWYAQSRIPNSTDIRKMPDPGEAPDALQQMRQVSSLLLEDIHSRGIRWAGGYGHVVVEPDALAEVLCDMYTQEPEAYADRGELTKFMHILPLQEAFTAQCEDWFAAIDRSRPISSWSTGMEALMARMGTTYDDFRSAVNQQNRANHKATSESLGRPVGEPPAPAETEAEVEESTSTVRRVGTRYN